MIGLFYECKYDTMRPREIEFEQGIQKKGVALYPVRVRDYAKTYANLDLGNCHCE